MSIVANWDLSHVTERVAYKHRVSNEVASEMEAAYREYVILLTEHPGIEVVVSADVDNYAHEHLLFTEDFARFQKALGGIINHLPVKNDAEVSALSEQYEQFSRPLVQRRFGQRFMHMWRTGSQVCKWSYIRDSIAA